LWFIRGDTDNKLLQEQGVHIWDGNSTREFLDSRGLQNYEEDELGPIYGYQWRHFNAPYITNKDKKFEEGLPENEQAYYNVKGGVDQLQQIIDALKDPAQRTSRRLIMTAWNPCQLEQMALPPCHVMCQFNVHDGNQLSCAMYQRSNDEACGTSFNIASYSFLTHLLAKHCGLEAYEFVYLKGNCHIYEEHVDGLKLQITREPYPFPTVSIKQIRDNINDYQVDDFILENYQHHDPIKFQMVA
jgi:thymidylate synthase